MTKKIFETAGENVNLIVTSLAKSLRSAIDIVCQDKDIQNITTAKSNWFGAIVENKSVSSTGSKILTTMSALFQMNSLLSVLASTTRSWGNGDKETYYTYKNGKLESHQRTVGKIDAAKASSNITTVVTAIANALRSAVDILYQDKDFVKYTEVEEGLFRDTVTTGKKSTAGGKIFTTMSALFSMNSLLRVLAGTARTWGDGSKELFYEWSNGNVKIKTVDVGKIDVVKATSNINIVINSLAKALKSAVDILYKDNDFVQFTKINMFDLFNTEKTTDNVQKIEDIEISAGNSGDYDIFEMILSPNDNHSYNQIYFQLNRELIDYNTLKPDGTYGREINISIDRLDEVYNVINYLNTSIDNKNALKQIGIQGPPGLLMNINGEAIRIGRSGLYEINNGIN